MIFLLVGVGTLSAVIFSALIIFLIYYFTTLYCNKHGWGTNNKYSKRDKSLGSIVMPMAGEINEESFREITEALNKRAKNMLKNKIDLIHSITTSIGPDRICYITVWIRSKEYYLRKPKPKITEGFKV